MINLDVKDRKILYELEKNCRQPVSHLAKNVGLSREVVNYRIKQLEQKGIIQHYVTTIDFVRLGLMFCRLLFKYNNVTKDIEQQMIESLKKDQHVAWLGLGDGAINLGLVYITNNINDLENSYYDFILRYSNYFKSHTLTFAFEIYHFPHSYLYDKSDRTPIIVGKNKEIALIDKNDYQILVGLMENPRINMIELSKKLELSVKTLSKRIGRLEDEKIILNYRIKINTSKLKLEHHKLFLYLENLTKEKFNMLISFLSQLKEVIFITLPFGSANIEFEIVVEGSVHLYELMRTININFPDLIRDYEDVFLYLEPITNYIPNIKDIQ